jgi:class 3 adenylate cyclase/tetratricopeptide (TPR) repeat protein
VQICDRCGEGNAESARFCQACGASIAPAGGHTEERKLVSVLFVDLVGSTSRADRADPEDVRDVLRLFFERVREQIERFDGTVEKFIGDAVVAVFGAPRSHGDDAERAVRCGLRVLDAIEELNAEHPELALTVRAAVNTGDAVVTIGSAHERGEALATGDVVNTASRLQSAAPPGRLVVGAETFRATRRAIRYEPLEPVDAKGKRDPLEAWLAIEPTSSPPPLPSIVGRDRELELLDVIWDRITSERRPHLVTVLGPPGIGKTRLTAEFVSRAEATGGRYIRGRCLPYEEQTGYRASAEQVKSVAGILETDPPPVAREKLSNAAAQLLPPDEVADVGRFLSLLLGLGLDEPSKDRLPLFFAVRRLVEGLGSERPTVVAFEDIHWAESAQLDLLEYLSSHVRDVPVVFLALARPELMDRRPAWGGGLSAQTTIPLEPLLAADCAAIAASLLGDAGGGSAELDRLVEVAGGNPLFVEELAASLAENASDGQTLPTTVREAISSRIDILPAEERSVLLDASVIGKTFWREVLRSIGQADGLDQALDTLESRDLIRRVPRSQVEGDEEFTFKHMLIREVAYGTLPRVAKRERHAAVARHVEAVSPDNVRDLAWLLAHHWREAGETAKAVTYLELAAERAREGWAKEESIALYGEALELVGDADPAARTRIRLLRGVGLVELSEFETGADELQEILPDLEGRDELNALLALGISAAWLERTDEQKELAERTWAAAERLGDPEMLGPALMGRIATSLTIGELEQSLSLGRRAMDLWVPGTRGVDLANLKEFLAEPSYWVGDYARAEELARSANELGGKIHQVIPMIRGGGWRALSLAAMGRTDEAIVLADAVVELSREMGNPRLGAAPLNYSSLAFRDLFMLQEARRRNEEAVEMVREHGELGMPLMQGAIDLLITDLLQGDVGRAQREWPAQWDAAINGKAWRPWLGGGRLALVRAEIAWAAEGAEATVEHALDAIERARRPGRRKYVAAGRALLGTALVELGRGPEGVVELRAAVEEADRLGSPTPRWRFRDALGLALYATGDDDGAARAHEEAATVIRDYAASLSPEHAAWFLAAEPVEEAMSRGR